jgi:hypothetical protein
MTQEEGKEGTCITAEVRVTASSCLYHFVAHTALLYSATWDHLALVRSPCLTINFSETCMEQTEPNLGYH